MTKTVLVLGALSAIGEATARLYAKDGATLLLVGRNQSRLDLLKDDLIARGAARCETSCIDLAEQGDANSVFAGWLQILDGRIDVAFLFYGVLGDQRADEKDLAAARRNIQINFTSAADWCLLIANQLEAQDGGVLVAISSVAGDRGRQSNYIYGAAKAGLSALVQGIAHRLAPTKARAVTVKLGFVDTPMTAHIEKSGPLWAKPADIAVKLLAIAEKPSAPVVYLPWFWRFIMLIIRTVPSAIFHKTKL